MSAESKNCDRLGISRALVIGVWTVTALLAVLVSLGGFLRGELRASGARAAVRALSLSNLSLAPSGTQQRDPALGNPAVDLRFMPVLPFMEADTPGLLLKAAQPGEKRRNR